MSRLSRIPELFHLDKSDENSSSYKYQDLKPEWIIHQGNLEYLYGETMFKTSLFKKCLIVLTCINDKRENLTGLYLYSDKNKNLYKYFQLDKNDQLKDICRKIIVGKAGVFFLELIFNKTDKSEIFAVQSDLERKLWIQKFNEAISKLNIKLLNRSVSDAASIRVKSPNDDGSASVQIHRINYTEFQQYGRNNVRSSIKSLPVDASSNQPYLEPCARQPTEQNDNYEEPDLILPNRLDEMDDESSAKDSSWNEIFYDNVKDDYTNVLNNIGHTGTFLVRPSATKDYSSEHQFTLCVYDDGHVRKFGIRQLPNHQYQITHRSNEPSFDGLHHLCAYYVQHPLHITLKDGLKKDIYLTYPYKHTNLYY